jgi:hypothetical protein
MKEIYIDGELDTVETANWFPKIARKDFMVGANLSGSGVDDPDAYTNLRKFPDTSVPSISGRIASAYGAGDAGAQATAQSERIRSWLVANRFQAVSQASMMSARLVNTELASQWLRR